jgi:hypothetical protein
MALLAVVGDVDGISGPAQGGLDLPRHVRVILNDKNPHAKPV